jgi:hypothetical protein
MSENPEYPMGTQVDPSEGAIDERAEQQRIDAADAEGQQSAMLEVDPSEEPSQS